jgi:hypothetical protein
MNRLRHLAILFLVTAFAVFQLLATAPLFHPDCESLETTIQAQHVREAPALGSPEGAAPRNADECPVCMVSGLAAILSPGLAVFAPTAHQDTPHLAPDASVRALRSQNLRSRAPPAA